MTYWSQSGPGGRVQLQCLTAPTSESNLWASFQESARLGAQITANLPGSPAAERELAFGRRLGPSLARPFRVRLIKLPHAIPPL